MISLFMAVSFGAGGAKLLKANHLAFFGRVYSTRMETASTHAICVAALRFPNRQKLQGGHMGPPLRRPHAPPGPRAVSPLVSHRAAYHRLPQRVRQPEGRATVGLPDLPAHIWQPTGDEGREPVLRLLRCWGTRRKYAGGTMRRWSQRHYQVL